MNEIDKYYFGSLNPDILDKVVCISLGISNIPYKLTIGKSYDSLVPSGYFGVSEFKWIRVVNDNNDITHYPADCFITLREYNLTKLLNETDITRFELVEKYQDKCFKLIKEYDYYCEDEKKVIHSPKVGTIISQLRDGGFETNDGEYTYFWYTS